MTINPNDLPEHLATLERYHNLRRILESHDGEPFDEGSHFAIVLYDEEGSDYSFRFDEMMDREACKPIIAAVKAGVEAERDAWRQRVIDAGFDADPALDNQINQLLMYATDKAA